MTYHLASTIHIKATFDGQREERIRVQIEGTTAIQGACIEVLFKFFGLVLGIFVSISDVRDFRLP